MVMVQCAREDGAEEEGGRRIIDYHVLHWDVVVLRLPAGQPVGSDGCHLLVVRRPPVPKRKPWRAVVMWTGEVERMRMTPAMAGAAVYIAMVGGGGTDMWRRSSRLSNRVSLMWAAEGRTSLVSFEGGAIAYTGKRGGRR